MKGNVFNSLSLLTSNCAKEIFYALASPEQHRQTALSMTVGRSRYSAGKQLISISLYLLPLCPKI